MGSGIYTIGCERLMPIYKVKGGYRIKNIRGKMLTLEQTRKRLAAIKAKERKK